MYGKTYNAGGRCGGWQQHASQPRYYQAPFGAAPYRRPKYNVPVNIAETETQYEVTVYATGFSKENVKISVVDDRLHISGTRSEEEAGKPQFTRQEFPVRHFERIIGLGDDVDTAAITARQENGVLHIILPKTAAAQAPAQEIKVD
jgi:HSP20 family protein